MNATTADIATKCASDKFEDADMARVLEIDRADTRHQQNNAPPRAANRILHLISELRRRQVCRTLTMYSVVLWVVCQVVDVVSPPLGLPEWTMKLVIVHGLIGFPIALILSWMFDITADGVLVEEGVGSSSRDTSTAGYRKPFDKLIDCSLLMAALVIGVQLATGIFTNDAYSASPVVQKVAVLPLRVLASENAEFLSQHLTSELQHEIASNTGMTVIAPDEHFIDSNCLTLSGAVAVNASVIRVTTTLVDNDTGEITWSKSFEVPGVDSATMPTKVAREIVAALPHTLLNRESASERG